MTASLDTKLEDLTYRLETAREAAKEAALKEQNDLEAAAKRRAEAEEARRAMLSEILD
jgi:hypothetical protein